MSREELLMTRVVLIATVCLAIGILIGSLL